MWAKAIGIILGICSIIGVFFGGYRYIDTQYAKASQIEKQAIQNEKRATQIEEKIFLVDKRLEQKIQTDKLYNLRQRIWQIEDRYKGKVMPPTVQEEYRNLKEEKKGLENLLK